MKKFDLKKAILENKATFHSSLNEGYDEFKRVEKGSKGVTAKDKGEEEVYGAGVKKGEEIEKKKLKENSNKPTTVPELIFQIQKKYPRMNWLESELPNNPTFQDVKGTLEDAGYGKVYDEFMGGDMADRMTDLNETNTKMKKSDLKAKIKEMIVAEYEKDVDVTDENPEKEEDFLSEIAAMLDESPMNDPRLKQVIQMLIDMDVDGETMEYILRQVGMEDQMANQLVNYPAEYAASLKEAEETEKDTAEVDTADVTVDDTETTDVETTAEVDPNVKAVQDSLTQAQAAAQALGDKKLIDQIGNTITFFTRAHVVEKPKAAGTVAEIEALKEMLLLQKKAGIISETQYKKKLEELETGTYKYYSKNELNDDFFKEFGNYVMFSAPVPPSDMDDEDEMSTSYFLVKPETADDNSKVDKFMELTLRRALRNKKVKIGTPNEKSGIATLSIPAIYVEK